MEDITLGTIIKSEKNEFIVTKITKNKIKMRVITARKIVNGLVRFTLGDFAEVKKSDLES